MEFKNHVHDWNSLLAYYHKLNLKPTTGILCKDYEDLFKSFSN